MAPWGQALVPRDDAPPTRDPWAWALALARTNEEELAVKEALQLAAKEARALQKRRSGAPGAHDGRAALER